MNLKIVFMGSADFSLPILEKLSENFEIQGIITQPDRPAGRGKILTPPPVKLLAQKLGIPFLQPNRLTEPEAWQQLNIWKPDLIVVAAFGQILKSNVLHFPPYGCLNVHASLLPRWRGAAPIAAAILHGDQHTGVTIMKMDEGIDTGPILRQKSIQIEEDDTTATLTHRLAIEGAELLIDTIPDYIKGVCSPIPQDHSLATYAPIIKKEDGFLNFNAPGIELVRKIRAFNPWPTAYTTIKNQRLIILEAQNLPKPHPGINPGQTMIIEKMPMIATADGYLKLITIQLAGKKPMSAREFLQGFRQWGEIVLPS